MTTTTNNTFAELVADDRKFIELAYLAGFFDGEGCIMIQRAGKLYGAERNLRFYVRVSVVNTNSINLYRFSELFGGHVSETFSKIPSHKNIYTWQISGKSAANFLLVIQPFLKMKYDQAELALEFQRTHHNGNGRGGFWGYDVEEVEYREFLCDEVKRLNSRGNNGS